MNGKDKSAMLNYWKAARRRLIAYAIYVCNEPAKDITIKRALDLFCERQNLERPSAKNSREWLADQWINGTNKYLKQGSPVLYKVKKKKVKKKIYMLSWFAL